MADWQRRLDLKDIWEQADREEMTIQALAIEVASRLKNLKPFGIADIDEEKEEIVMEFEDLNTMQNLDFEDFNEVMERLYNWADQKLDSRFGGKAVCWVATNF